MSARPICAPYLLEPFGSVNVFMVVMLLSCRHLVIEGAGCRSISCLLAWPAALVMRLAGAPVLVPARPARIELADCRDQLRQSIRFNIDNIRGSLLVIKSYFTLHKETTIP